MESDEDLLAAYAAGDARAFAELYERHERAIYRFFLRQGAATSAADDLLQETWIAVVRNAANFEPRAKFTTWLYTVARSKMIDHWRARDDTVSLAYFPVMPPMTGRRDARHSRKRRAASGSSGDGASRGARFPAAVEALPPAQREAFLLQAEGGLSLDEIAAATGAAHETVKSRLRYAMSKLRSAMEAWQ